MDREGGPERKLSTYEQERSEDEVRDELTPEQSEEIDQMLDHAKGKNTRITGQSVNLIGADDVRQCWADVDKLSPFQKKDAVKRVEEWLKKKEKYLQEYDEELQKGVKDGVLTPKDRNERLKEYLKKNGKERKKDYDQLLPKWLENKRKERKDFEAQLNESPHFSKDGKLTKEGKKRFDEFNKLPEEERGKAQRKLATEIERLENYAEQCKEHYQKAKEVFREGDFDEAKRLMKINERTCKRYPWSARFTEYLEWAQSDMNNLGYEKKKATEIEERREDMSVALRAKDYDEALKLSTESVALSNRFMEWTFDGKQGEYHDGAQEKPRGEKWVTPYMKRLQEKVEHEDKEVSHAYDLFAKKEIEKEEEHREEKEGVGQAFAQGKIARVTVKAAEDMAEKMEKGTLQKGIDQRKIEQAPPGEVPAGVSVAARGEEPVQAKPGESMLESIEEKAEQEGVGAGAGGQHYPGVDATPRHVMEQKELKESTEEKMGEKIIELKRQDRTEGERLQQYEAEKILRTEGAELELTPKQGRTDLDTKEKIRRETGERLMFELKMTLDQQRAQGQISDETYHEMFDLLKTEDGRLELSTRLLEAHRTQGRIIRYDQRERGTEKIKDIFEAQRVSEEKKESGGKVKTIEELRKEAAERKAKMKEEALREA